MPENDSSYTKCDSCGCRLLRKTYQKNQGLCAPCQKQNHPKELHNYCLAVLRFIGWFKIRIIIAIAYGSLTIANLTMLGLMPPFHTIPQWIWSAAVILIPFFLAICAYTELSSSKFAKNLSDWMWTFICGTGGLMLIGFIVLTSIQ